MVGLATARVEVKEVSVLEIRLATPEDRKAILGTYEELFAHEREVGSTTNWREGLYPSERVPDTAIPAGQMYVLDDAGVIRASMMLNTDEGPGYGEVEWVYPANAAAGEVLVIHTLVVAPSSARRGLGKLMLDFALNHGRELGCKVCRIDTWVGNEPALRFYERNGFRRAGVIHALHWGVIDEDQVLLERRL